MRRIERDIDIAASPKRVFGELVSWDGLTRWSTITVDHDGPGRCANVGDTFKQTIRIGGIHLPTQWKVVEFTAPRAVAYEATGPASSFMRMRQEVFAGKLGGSTVRLEVEYELPAGVLGEVADKLYMHRRNEREAEHTLSNLKDLIEHDDVSSH